MSSWCVSCWQPLRSSPLAGRVSSQTSAPRRHSCRGALATFDDVTKVEEQNEQLQVMLKKLEKSRDEIRRKNKELKILATTDPLTGCQQQAANDQRGAILIGDLDQGGFVDGFVISADLRVGGGTDNPADGFSFNVWSISA